MLVSDLRAAIRADTLKSDADKVPELAALADLTEDNRKAISARAAELVRSIRGGEEPGLMEVFLAEYGLSTNEGVALMCLAEALLRVPDADTMDALIEDKIGPSDWGKHLGHSASSLVNASTWALMLTGKVLQEDSNGVSGVLQGLVKRLGEPVIRSAVSRAMKEMGRQFVLGETIKSAMRRAKQEEQRGYSYSYDMLGEAARTEADAKDYFDAYASAINSIADAATTGDIRTNPGISVKLSALYARYEHPKRKDVMLHLVPRLSELCKAAAKAQIGLNIDAEEADRLDLSLDVIEAALSDPDLAGWDGFGVVVQAYGPRAGQVIDWLYALADRLDRRIMVRLVKGAYWDTEIKRAQVLGLSGFPVFTRKAVTDLSYIANARKLLNMTDRIYPQFATHNAHTVAAILHMAGDHHDNFEFQRLHGMGERLHDIVLDAEKTKCRIYAPVGAHHDLLAYLVRRLLENGANSSFVNQIVDEDVSPEEVAADPIPDIFDLAPLRLQHPGELFPGRSNSQGWDWTDPSEMDALQASVDPFFGTSAEIMSRTVTSCTPSRPVSMRSPGDPADLVSTVRFASPADVSAAIASAEPWNENATARAQVLRQVADLYEDNHGEIFALLQREAGKTWPDAISELREAVDFLRYYALDAEQSLPEARGIFTCISPWNFPLAIFTGQIAAALAAGNAVIAKPAQQTPAIADLAVSLMHKAGVPISALQLVQGAGEVGAALTASPDIDGVCFTGSTATAKAIHRAIAETGNPTAPLIAETGGLNAMIVDSTALPEQAVRDIIASAFQSAGQRCSALRCLYVQEDVAPALMEMLSGALDLLSLGDPRNVATDVGPIIDAEAKAKIDAHIEQARQDWRIVAEGEVPSEGHFVAPTIIKVAGIEEMQEEIFGPVLHVATFKAKDLDKVIDTINASGYGLTFGLHTRIDDRVQDIVDKVHAGNIYVNRNQIGAVVGSQPFGGEGLSGTGPKAGGPLYLAKFAARSRSGGKLGTLEMPGPTGETNRLTTTLRGPFLCAGPDTRGQMEQLEALGVQGVEGNLENTAQFSGVLWSGDSTTAREIRRTLASRDGPILPLISATPRLCDVVEERHVCIDTTASGGNAALLAEVARED